MSDPALRVSAFQLDDLRRVAEVRPQQTGDCRVGEQGSIQVDRDNTTDKRPRLLVRMVSNRRFRGHRERSIPEVWPRLSRRATTFSRLVMVAHAPQDLSLIHISEPTRLGMTSYA